MPRRNVSTSQARDKFPTRTLQLLIDSIQVKNIGVSEEEVREDVAQAVESVRQERFLESIRQASAHKSG